MKQKVVLVIIAIVGLGVGLAVGIVITNSKSKAAIARLQQSEASSQEKIRGYNDIVIQLNNELRQAKIELEQLKQAAPTTSPAAEQAVTVPAVNEKTAAAPADNSIPENTNLYTIKSGDSLWSIAQKQLGDGNRFKEILKLNPQISAKGNLVVGAKLKIPAK